MMANIDLLTRENQQLKLAVNELKVLNDIATTISSTQPVEEIIDQIVLKCIKHLDVQEGTISLLEQKSEDGNFRTMIRRQDSSTEKVPIRLDDSLTGWMLKNRSVLLSNDISEDDRFKFLNSDSYSFRSILCAPLMIKGDLIGYLAVFNKKDGYPFSNEDRRLLSIIGSQSAQVIENARLYEEEKALLSLQEEMRMARDIQLNLLPDKTPEIPGFQIAATNIPAKSVGGDYYDFITLSSGRLGFCVGDITGKGMPAAMLMANLQATFQSQAMIFEDCKSTLKGINKLLFRNTESTKFATFFYGILDQQNATLEYANGGHDTPILFKNGKGPEFLEATGLLLGVMENSVYEKGSVSLQPGDLLILYSDGITEAMNPEGNQFGINNLIQLAQDNRNNTAETVTESIITGVKQFANSAPQSDDITLMVIKRE